MFDVFLSYSRSDQGSVEAIARALGDAGLTPFLDRWHLTAGHSWQELLAARLKDCKAVAIFIGPGEMGSWQQREKDYALDRQAREGRFPVIPVLLPGVDDPALDFLGLNTWIDLRGGISDARAIETLVSAIRGETPATRNMPEPQAAICPYRGLQPFREEDAAFFFGRDAFTATLSDKLKHKRFLAVVGASGSGKSSVVRAGLVPELRKGKTGTSWEILTLVPGTEPLHALVQAFDPPSTDLGRIHAIAQIKERAALLREGLVSLNEMTDALLRGQPGTDRLLLVIDQFEELYTLLPSKRAVEGEYFLDLILAATSDEGRLSVVLTMRGDFYARALSRRDLNDRLQDAVVNIGPLDTQGSPSELETVIRKPAEAVGLTFEEGLVERILADVGAEPGNLPLLEFLLTELWRLRGRAGQMTNTTYTELGGVEGAIAARADATLGQLNQEQLRDAKRLMLLLVRPGEGQEDTRTRVAIPEDPALEAVIDRFTRGDARLLVTSEDAVLGRTVEVSHEALIRNWLQLRDWVDENRDRLRARTRVRDRMERWAEAGKPEGLLLPAGLDLEEGRALLANTDDLPVEDIAPFINVSIAVEEAQRAAVEAEREAGRQRELRAQQKRRNLFAGAFAITLALLFLAGWQWFEAQEQTKIAEEQAEIATARRLAAQANVEIGETATGAIRGALLAVESLRRLQTFEGNLSWLKIMNLLPETSMKLEHPGLSDDSFFDVGQNLSFSPNGQWIAATGIDNRVRLWSVNDGSLVFEVMHTSKVTRLDFSPDNRLLAVSSEDQTISLWSLADRRRAGSLSHDVPVEGLKFSPSGDLIAADTESTTWIWDVATRKKLTELSYTSRGMESAFSKDSRYFATASFNNGVVVWDVKTGEELHHFLPGKQMWSVSFAKDGKWLAAGQSGMDYPVTVWDIETGRPLASLRNDGWSRTISFSPDGKWLVTGNSLAGNSKGELKIYDTRDWSLINTFQHDGEVVSVAFSADGNLLVSNSKEWRAWSVPSWREVHRTSIDGEYREATLSANDRWLAAASKEGPVNIWDLASRAEIRVADATRLVIGVQVELLGSNRSTALSLPPGVGVRVREVTPNLPAEHAGIRAGDIIAAVNKQPLLFENVQTKGFFDGVNVGATVMLDIIRGEERFEVLSIPNSQPVPMRILPVSISPSGKYIAALANNDIHLIDVATGLPVAQYPDMGSEKIDLSADGRWIARQDKEESVQLFSTDSYQAIGALQFARPVEAVHFSPDERHLVVLSGETLSFYRFSDGVLGTMAMEFEVVPNENRSIAFDAEGSRVAVLSAPARSGSQSRAMASVQLIDTRKRAEIARIEMEASRSDGFSSIVLSRDGQWLAGQPFPNSRFLLLWNTNRAQPEYLEEEKSIAALAFSPDSKYLVTGLYDTRDRGVTLVRDLEREEIVHRREHTHRVTDVAFDTSNQLIASADKGGIVQVFDIYGQDFIRLDHGEAVDGVEFVTDGARIWSVTESDGARIWDIDAQNMVNRLCARLHRNFSQEEWRGYLGHEPYRATCPNLPAEFAVD